MIQANERVVGDDWVFHASTEDDVADHENLVVEIRDHQGELIASSQGDDPTLIIDGVDDPDSNLVVPATEFSEDGADIWAVVRRSVTRTAAPGWDATLQMSVDSVQLGGRRTIGTAVFELVDQVARETLP